MASEQTSFVWRGRNPAPLICIFCDDKADSGEHIFADWMRPYLLDDSTRTSHFVSDFHQELSRGPMDRAGDYRSRTSRVVCENCNNRWMSQMQTAAIPKMTPLLKGQHKLLDQNSSLVVANWATMFTMVKEFDHQPTIAVPKSDRELFKSQLVPPPNWQIYLARFSGNHTNGAVWHRALGSRQTHESVSDYKTQITMGAVGKLFFVTFSTNDNRNKADFVPKFALEAMANGLKLAWPLKVEESCNLPEASEFKDSVFDGPDPLMLRLMKPLRRIADNNLKRTMS